MGTPATLLLEKRRLIVEVQKSLNENKEEYARKESYFQKREQQLRKKDLELQENLIQFNKFLKDKADKRNQYLKKAEKERAERIQKEQEIKIKQKEIADVTDQCRNLETEFRGLEKYENYLENVKQTLEEYPEIECILKRYQVLSDAERDLNSKESSSSLELERLRKETSDFSEEQNTKYIDMNNKQQRLLKDLEDDIEITTKLQTELESLVHHESNRSKELTEICTSIFNIFDRSHSIFSCTKIKLKQGDDELGFKEKMQQRLDVVGQYVTDATKIIEEHQASAHADRTNRTTKSRRTKY